MHENNDIFTQLHCSRYNLNLNDIVINNDLDFISPYKGLWCSTFNTEYGSHWYQSRLREFNNWIIEIETNISIDTPLYSGYFLLHLKKDSPICELNNIKDINDFCRNYGNDIQLFLDGHKYVPSFTGDDLIKKTSHFRKCEAQLKKRNESLSSFKIDYNKVCKKYDMINLTYQGISQCNTNNNIYKIWDSESSYILNKQIIIDVEEIESNEEWNKQYQISLYSNLKKIWLPLLNKKIKNFTEINSTESIGTDGAIEIYDIINAFYKKNPKFLEEWSQFFQKSDNFSLRRHILKKFYDLEK